jgi:hypothetical protein
MSSVCSPGGFAADRARSPTEISPIPSARSSGPDSSFDSLTRMPDDPTRALRCPGLPRRPGIYPPDFSSAYHLTSQPIPGQGRSTPTDVQTPVSASPLAVSERFQSMGAGCPTSMMVTARAGLGRGSAARLNKDRRTAMNLTPIRALATPFNDVDIPVPLFKLRPQQYPSGNALGTQLCPRFADRVKELGRPRVPA